LGVSPGDLVWRAEPPVGAQVRRPRQIDRAWNMARNRVDWLLLSGVTLRSAYVDQGRSIGFSEPRIYLRPNELWPLARVRDEITARCRRIGPGDSWQSGSVPGGEAAVKDFDGTVSGISQEPPKARSGLRVGCIVRDDQRILAHADVPHRLFENGKRR
jgi:hypothetical protein